MRRLVVLVVAIGVCVSAASGALAKGASAVTITGPGTGDTGPIALDTRDSAGVAPDLVQRLAEHTGIYEAAYSGEHARLLTERPPGDLGPKHTITWSMYTPSGVDATVAQDLYPYAEGGAVTYTPGGQAVIEEMQTRPGWFVGGEPLHSALTGAGLSADAPQAPRVGLASMAWVAALVVIMVGLAAGVRWAVAARRRPASVVSSH